MIHHHQVQSKKQSNRLENDARAVDDARSSQIREMNMNKYEPELTIKRKRLFLSRLPRTILPVSTNLGTIIGP